MHDRSTSTDSSLMLRRNPLNIRAGDGSDFVLEDIGEIKKDAQQPVEVKKPVSDVVEELGISEPTAKEIDHLKLSLESNIGSSLGGSLTQELASFSLSRSNTIAARGGSSTTNLERTRSKNQGFKTGPSRNPELIKRLRSIREKMSKENMLKIPEPADDNEFERRPSGAGLPDNVLQMIAFSPDSPWLASEIESFGSPESDDLDSEPSTTTHTPTIEDNEASTFKDGADEIPTEPLTATNSAESEETIAEAAVATPTSVEARKQVPTPVNSSESVQMASSAVVVEEEEPVKKPKLSTKAEIDPVSEDDRGRLFLQINRASDINSLPIDASRNPRFTLTLDNGLQTVTTAPMTLPSPSFNGVASAKISQEFELMVAKDLELVLTINVIMDDLPAPERPVFREVYTPSPPPSPKKGMRSLLSPKKAKVAKKVDDGHQEALRTQERITREYEEQFKRYRQRQNLWKGIVGPQGEFCRGYLFESHYEREIFGKARSYSLPLYNEWSLDTKGSPKHVCDLQVTMMFVPKLYQSEELPSSLKECQRQLEAATARKEEIRQGYLTQLGGDCSMWRRRFFILKDGELIGYHEATRKLRISVPMANVEHVAEATSDDFWCVYEDRSFQLQLSDGEYLSFYADTVEERNFWIHSLRSSIAYCAGQQSQWTDLILSRT